MAAFQGRQAAGVAKAAESHRTRADQWAEKRRIVLQELVDTGLSLGAMARELTARKITTRNGGAWTAKACSRVIRRLELSPATA